MRNSLISENTHYLVVEPVNRDRFFKSDHDYHYGFDQIIELSTTHEVSVYAWRLLSGQIHVLVGSNGPANDISRFIKALAFRVAAWGRSEFGLLWPVTFRCCPVEEGAWVLACMRYIESLPGEDGNREYTGSRAKNSYYVRSEQSYRWMIDFHPRYCMLGRTHAERFETYCRYMRHGSLEREREAIFRALRLSEPIGSEIFAHRCRKRNGVPIGDSSQGDA